MKNKAGDGHILEGDGLLIADSNTIMSHQKEGVNPLRPYYIPPSIGEEPVPAQPGPHAFAQARGNATGKYASKARDIFSDMDYKDYLSEPSPSAIQTVRDLIDELLWKYTSALLAQPFEVAKTILQVRSQDDLGTLDGVTPFEDAKQRQLGRRTSIYDDVCAWNFKPFSIHSSIPLLLTPVQAPRLGFRPG